MGLEELLDKCGDEFDTLTLTTGSRLKEGKRWYHFIFPSAWEDYRYWSAEGFSHFNAATKTSTNYEGTGATAKEAVEDLLKESGNDD